MFSKNKKNIYQSLIARKKTVLSNMSDWNPAEIIGFKPSKLSITLYDELVTNNIWAE